MARVALIVLATASIVGMVSGFEKQISFEKSVDIDLDPTKAVDTVFAGGVGSIAPSDATRAACESYGFIDEDKKTGNTAQHGIWSIAKGLADTFLPNSANRAACIKLGYFHPKD